MSAHFHFKIKSFMSLSVLEVDFSGPDEERRLLPHIAPRQAGLAFLISSGWRQRGIKISDRRLGVGML